LYILIYFVLQSTFNMNKINRLAVGTAYVLLIPILLTLLAIWRWKPGSIILAGVILLGGIGLAYTIFTKKVMNNRAYLSGVGLVVLTVFGLVWMNAAVGGILGDDPANMMYFGVLLVGLVGSARAQLEPRGMSQTLFAMAFAIILVPAIAAFIGTPAVANRVLPAVALHAIFAIAFIGAALLFRKAAHNPGE
jgi:cytochrome c biogenesis protein CcdA